MPPSCHNKPEFPRDDRRNDAFYEGLRDAVVPNVSHVIDLGAGTCLLSMMAARLGAQICCLYYLHVTLNDV